MQNQISKIVAFPKDINLHYDKLGGGVGGGGVGNLSPSQECSFLKLKFPTS